jgi:hypothetical protein
MLTRAAQTDRRILKAVRLLSARNRGQSSLGSVASFTGIQDEELERLVGRLADSGLLRRREVMTPIGRVCFVAMPDESQDRPGRNA